MITYSDLPGIYVSTEVADRVRRYLRMMERNQPEPLSITSEARNGETKKEPGSRAGLVQPLAELGSVHEKRALGILAEWDERRADGLLWPMPARGFGEVLPT